MKIFYLGHFTDSNPNDNGFYSFQIHITDLLDENSFAESLLDFLDSFCIHKYPIPTQSLNYVFFYLSFVTESGVKYPIPHLASTINHDRLSVLEDFSTLFTLIGANDAKVLWLDITIDDYSLHLC